MSDMNPSPDFEEKVRRAVAVPSPNPEFVNRLRNELVRGPVRMKPRFVLKPAWAVAFVVALAILVLSLPGVAAAVGRLLGYVPNVGLVENTGSLRMLAEPVSVTRDGVTLTITSVFVYADHVELIYEVKGIDPSNDGGGPQNAAEDMKAFCGPMASFDGNYLSDGDAALRLPDGTIIKRMFGNEYPQNVFAMKPVYKTSIPSDVTGMTLVLKCIPWARLGAVPENWEVPFELVSVPAGTVVGAPVIEVEQPTEEQSTEAPVGSPPIKDSAIPAPVLKMTLEKIVPLDSSMVFYFSMDMENKDPSLVSIMPVTVYVIDSSGQKIQLIGNYTWQPFEHRTGSLFEFTSMSKPADGPLTVLVENAVAYYAPLYVEPPQATPDEMSFTFDAGENPQHGQTWPLNHAFEIAGYELKVTSARASTFADIQVPGVDHEYGSQGYDYGYDFAVEADPSIRMQVEMDIISESPICGLTNVVSVLPESSSIHYTQLCWDTYPKGLVKVTIRELSVLVENTWQATWTPQ